MSFEDPGNLASIENFPASREPVSSSLRWLRTT
eukprot:CAMPEP_0183356612 /NCGR_PEP_ID=MMETSP0164_2-20130417/45088_1 /TAXON_ID=221442 /ORGANISM="Coccolithus pelagicus ssp braarudi, Strain PLY182g" /LENGTH=32 /DNA_ID= /DNA_START= /DNA_END= /DNA_ORIENTATION=